jgi:hypothetical protein
MIEDRPGLFVELLLLLLLLGVITQAGARHVIIGMPKTQ